MSKYTHGHQESVLRHHSARTAENSAAFLLPHLASGVSLLDVGCGPGSITVDLAERVAPGRVLGIDPVQSVLDEANALAAQRRVGNVEFLQGSTDDLPVPDESFDIVYAHQVLQHLTDPVTALAQMRRVLKQDGIVAVRDADYAGMIWAPGHAMLDRWMELYHQVTLHNGAEADAGRYLLRWLQDAGFTDIEVTTSTWTYADAASRAWWGQGWTARAVESSFARQAIEYGYSDEAELSEIAEAWTWWSQQPDGFFAIVHGDALARR